MDDARAPAFARTVDIHRKPGYDPVELFFDPVTKGIPLDATLVRGSHGVSGDNDARAAVFGPGRLARVRSRCRVRHIMRSIAELILALSSISSLLTAQRCAGRGS